MKKVLALGNNEFTLGFQLSGVSTFRLNDADPDGTIAELIANKDIGLIIVGPETVDKLGAGTKEKIMQSIEPVFLVISQQDTNGELRKLVKKSIGVDVWNK